MKNRFGKFYTSPFSKGMDFCVQKLELATTILNVRHVLFLQDHDLQINESDNDQTGYGWQWLSVPFFIAFIYVRLSKTIIL